LAGAGSSYAITSATLGDAATYRVVVTNSLGSVTSDAAVLTVRPASSIQLMDGATVLSEVYLGYMMWHGHGRHRDFDGDGKADISLAEHDDRRRSLWLMNGTHFREGVDLGIYATAWSIAGTGISTATGKQTFLAEHDDRQRSVADERDTHPRGRRSWTYATAWSIAGTGDFDGDGKADILCRTRRPATQPMADERTHFREGVDLDYATDWNIAAPGLYGDGR